MNNLSKGFHLIALLAFVTLTGCSDDNPWSGSSTEGGIRMNFTVDAEVECLTRAADNQSPMSPGEKDFRVGLKSSDGTYSKEWKSLEDFNNEKGFPIGDYTVSVFHGDLDTEGIRAPYYTGNSPVHVSPGAVSDVNVTAALANAMVSVRYTDEFKSMFRSFSSSLLTTGHTVPVILEGSETRPAYVSPTEVTLGLTLTNDEGKSVTVEPIKFPALARHHHIVTLGVNSNSSKGTATLEVTFDDALVDDPVSISLGDELFSTPAPEIQPKGIVPEEPLQTFEYAKFAKEAQLDVVAFGGMKSVILEITGESGYAPAFGNSVELVNADAVAQAQLSSSGLECSGFFKEGGKMGVIDLAGFISKLKHGEYTISLKVVDGMSRAANPFSFKVKVSEVGVEVLSTQTPSFFSNSMYVDVSTDCPEIKDAMTFMVGKSPVTVTSVSSLPASSDYTYNNVFRYELEVPEIKTASVTVQATLGNRIFNKDIAVEKPVIKNITTDAFAQKVWLKIQGDTDEHTKYLCDHVSFYNGDIMIPYANIKYNQDNDLFSISGLESSKAYDTYKIKLDTYEWSVPAFTTESQTPLTIGIFAPNTMTTTINTDWIDAGGKYKYGATTMQNKSKIMIKEPSGWSSSNSRTCNLNKSNQKNTWFMVPSVLFCENDNSILIRSVAYDYNGKLPALDDHGLSVKFKYSGNAPESFANKESGELSLGSNGITFGSRPASVSFNYKYETPFGERGEVVAEVLDSSGNVISSGSLELGGESNFVSKTINLNYSASDFGRKAASLKLSFKSTKGSNVQVVVPTGSALQDVNNKTDLSGQKIPANEYKSLAVGSKLWVSNVSLGY